MRSRIFGSACGVGHPAARRHRQEPVFVCVKSCLSWQRRRTIVVENDNKSTQLSALHGQQANVNVVQRNLSQSDPRDQGPEAGQAARAAYPPGASRMGGRADRQPGPTACGELFMI